MPPDPVGRYTVFVTPTPPPHAASFLTTTEQTGSAGPIGARSCGFWLVRAVLACAGLAAAAAVGAGATGCGEALIDDNQERSQYDRYDALRDQRPPAAVEDEFGNRKPNLRGRLLRRD